MVEVGTPERQLKSPSSRRAWVEIDAPREQGGGRKVALLAEGVGRNNGMNGETLVESRVALLAEGVGRNLHSATCCSMLAVALLAEGVGRNQATERRAALKMRSPSSRRAWVEMASRCTSIPAIAPSPSSRRAWVEIWR